MSNQSMAYMNALTLTPSDACSWYAHRFNVVAWGEVGVTMPSRFVYSLDEAQSVRESMLANGASEVMVYDTVDGIFY